jgi:hypothetical protein
MNGQLRTWDHDECPRDGCDGELSQQDRLNVMCRSCEEVWTHVRTETEHKLQTAEFEIVAEKPIAKTDGGQSPSDPDPIDVYPPGRWSPRPSPTADDVESALRKARDWWPWAVSRSDDSIQSFVGLFERYLSGNVRRRAFAGGGQRTLVTDGGQCAGGMERSTVYVTGRSCGGGPERSLHTDSECPILEQASSVFEKDASVFPDSKPVCSVCTGEYDRPESNDMSHLQSLKAAAEADSK